MGSKLSPSHRLHEDQPGTELDQDSPSAPVSSPLLRRVAGALQVPVSDLYSPPNAVTTPPRAALVDRFDEDAGAALVRAFKRIQDPEVRRRLLNYTQSLAEQA